MLHSSLKFRAVVPRGGFRWIYWEPSNEWRLRPPPDEWPEQDLAAARFSDRDAPEPLISSRFHLAMTLDEYEEGTRRDDNLREEPDLYLRFASGPLTPATILEFANSYGLLDPHEFAEVYWEILEEDAEELIPVLGSQRSDREPGLLYLIAEPASLWLAAFERIRFFLAQWSEMEARGARKEMKQFLDQTFNHDLHASLSLQVKMDTAGDEPRTEIIANSLRQLVDAQWSMSLAADVHHRQCAECPNWFAVHPGSGRPEKAYCSDACRMRAYRKRKHVASGQPKRGRGRPRKQS